MQGVINSLSKIAIDPDPKRRASEFDPSLIPPNFSHRLEWKNDPSRNPALPIVSVLKIIIDQFFLKSFVNFFFS